ncbi:MAG: AMP-binding enzyme [Desulfocucumaceae bacterium]
MSEQDRHLGYIPDEATGSGQALIRKVEEVIYRHPGVDEVAAVYLPGMDGKYDLAAFIVPSDSSLTPQIIKHFVEGSGQLSAEQFPSRYHMVPEIPKTPSGKCQKQKLVQSLVGD